MPTHNSLTLKILLAVVLFVFIAGCTVLPNEGVTDDGAGATKEPSLPQPKTLTDPREIELSNAIQKAAEGREDLLAFIIFRVVVDHVDFSKDGNTALVWVSMVDKNTGLVQSAELGLIIAQRTADVVNPWQVTFQPDNTFAELLQSLPDSLLSEEGKAYYLPAVQQPQKGAAIFRGYRLPWTAGQTVRLTGSIGHVYVYKSCPTTCLYAFDFANGEMFPVRAAKAGTVKYVVWDKVNGNTTSANYIVLEDRTTDPVTFQVYSHFAQNTIPTALRKVGAKVVQGQFIGNADDTGYSSGHHLHFHVHTSTDSYWGKSVDIVFDEVTINGGRPRMCSEVKAYPQFGTQCMPYDKYVSKNKDAETPTGGITNPEANSTVTAPTLNVAGWMKDDTGVASGQLMIKTSGDWSAIGSPVIESPFSTEINLCEAKIPNGKFYLSVVVTDKAGKDSTGTQGLTELTKDYKCPPSPPVCVPTDTQVALYSETEFQGKCQLLEIGKYNNLNDLDQVKSNETKAIQVGAGVSAILYADNGFDGTMEYFQNGDSDLADNPIGSANAASVKVVTRILPPEPPTLIIPAAITTKMDLILNWTTAEDVSTRADLTSTTGYANVLDWQSGGAWQVGTLAEGEYTLTVEAKNLAGSSTISQAFTVMPAAVPPATHMEPLPQITNSTAVMLNWEVDSGADGIDHFNLQYKKGDGEWKDWTEPLTTSARQLLFWADPDKVYQFRIRAVDLIGTEEDFTADAEATTMVNGSCSEDAYEGITPGDDEWAGSSPMEAGTTQTHNWCAAGDVDWVTFQAAQGDKVKITTAPVGLASGAVAQLYETDGTTLIGEARPGDALSGAALAWITPLDGTYSIKLIPVDERIVGVDTTYELAVEKESTVQPTTLVCGSATITALLAGAYALTRAVQKKKPKRVGW